MRPSSMFGPAWLAWEAQQVIALRMARFAFGGPGAAREAERMVTEKIDAAFQAAGLMSRAIMDGAPEDGARQVGQMLHRRVRANKARLLG